jgi:hypothetical protein
MPVVFKKTYTAHEAISLMESISVSDEESSSSDDDDEEGTRFRRNGFIVLQPPRERPDAITDEDSDYEDTGNADRLPRRILNAPAEFSNKSFKTKAKLPSEMTYKISNSNYSDPTTVQTPDAGAQASPIVTAQSSVVEVDPSESTIDSTESCEGETSNFISNYAILKYFAQKSFSISKYFSNILTCIKLVSHSQLSSYSYTVQPKQTCMSNTFYRRVFPQSEDLSAASSAQLQLVPLAEKKRHQVRRRL